MARTLHGDSGPAPVKNETEAEADSQIGGEVEVIDLEYWESDKEGAGAAAAEVEATDAESDESEDDYPDGPCRDVDQSDDDGEDDDEGDEDDDDDDEDSVAHEDDQKQPQQQQKVEVEEHAYVEDRCGSSSAWQWRLDKSFLARLACLHFSTHGKPRPSSFKNCLRRSVAVDEAHTITGVHDGDGDGASAYMVQVNYNTVLSLDPEVVGVVLGVSAEGQPVPGVGNPQIRKQLDCLLRRCGGGSAAQLQPRKGGVLIRALPPELRQFVECHTTILFLPPLVIPMGQLYALAQLLYDQMGSSSSLKKSEPPVAYNWAHHRVSYVMRCLKAGPRRKLPQEARDLLSQYIGFALPAVEEFRRNVSIRMNMDVANAPLPATTAAAADAAEGTVGGGSPDRPHGRVDEYVRAAAPGADVPGGTRTRTQTRMDAGARQPAAAAVAVAADRAHVYDTRSKAKGAGARAGVATGSSFVTSHVSTRCEKEEPEVEVEVEVEEELAKTRFNLKQGQADWWSPNRNPPAACGNPEPEPVPEKLQDSPPSVKKRDHVADQGEALQAEALREAEQVTKDLEALRKENKRLRKTLAVRERAIATLEGLVPVLSYMHVKQPQGLVKGASDGVWP